MTDSRDQQTETRLRVFVSYSRRDLAAAERLRDRLIERGFDAYLDKHDILPGEPWQERLASLIEMADAVVFLLSPDSVSSEICDWEVNEAERLAKRILPVVIRDTAGENVPGRLKRLNYIFIRNVDEEVDGFPRLSDALMTDISWVRDHTRIGELAAEWERNRCPPERLLRGSALTAAELWVSRPNSTGQSPTSLHVSFITESRKNEQSLAAAERSQVARTRRFQKRAGWALAAVAILVLGSAILAALQTRSAAQREARVLTSLAQKAIDEEKFDRAMRIALLGLPPRGAVPFVSPWSQELEIKLAGSAAMDQQLCSFQSGETNTRAKMVMSSDGSRLAVHSQAHKRFRLWDLESCKLLATIDVGDAVTYDFVNGDTEVEVRLSDRRLHIETKTGHVREVTASKSGQSYADLLSGRERQGSRILLPLAGGHGPTSHHSFVVIDAARSRMGAKPANTPSGLFTLDTPDLHVLARISAPDTAFQHGWLSTDGLRVITLDLRNKVNIWDATSGVQISETIALDKTRSIREVQISEDRKRLLLISGEKEQEAQRDNYTAQLLDAATGQEIARIEPIGSGLHEFAPATSDLSTLALFSYAESAIKVWNLNARSQVDTIRGFIAAIASFALRTDGKRLVTLESDGAVRVWSVQPNLIQAEDVGIEGGRTLGAVSSDGSRVLLSTHRTGPNATSHIWQSGSQRRAMPLTPDQEFGFVSISPDGTRAVSLGGTIWDTTTGQSIEQLRGLGGPVVGAAYPEESIVVAVDLLGDVALVDAMKKSAISVLKGHQASVIYAPISPNGQYVVTISHDHSARLWSAKTGSQLTMLVNSDSAAHAPYSAVFSPDGSRFAVATNDNLVRIWRLADLSLLATIKAPQLAQIVFSNDGARIAFYTDGIVIWDIETVQKVLTIRAQQEIAAVMLDADRRHLVAVGLVGGRQTIRKWDLGWPMTTSGEGLRDRICRDRLQGATTITPADAEDPILTGLTGTDVCNRFGPISFSYWVNLGRRPFGSQSTLK